MPDYPDLATPPNPANTHAKLEPGFFSFFGGLASGIKDAANYDVADGILLGIEGTEMLPPNPATMIPISRV